MEWFPSGPIELTRDFANYNCSKNWTSFIVPFRNREKHLPYFLKAIKKHQFQNGQDNNYEILLVEQTDSALFNRAKLLNIGAKFAQHRGQEKCSDPVLVNKKLCLMFHDIDMLPLNPELQYDCNQR